MPRRTPPLLLVRLRRALRLRDRYPLTHPQASLLVRAAELKRDKPQEDEATRLAREELEILRSITARLLRRALFDKLSDVGRKRRRSCL